MMMMMPTGFRFSPTDEELIQILERKVSGQEMLLHDSFIVERNVCELDPQDLEWDHMVLLSNNERFCYYTRETDSREVSGQGWWRATGHVKKIYSNNSQVVGYKRPLTFLRFKDHERKRKNAFKTNWIMHEYSLHSNTTEWRLCKIKYKGKESVKDELKNIRKGYSVSNDFESSSSITVLHSDPVGEEQQLENLYESYSEGSGSTGMLVDFVSKQLQQQPRPLKHEVHEPYFRQNMQMEVIDEQPQCSYDPILTQITSTNYYLYDHFDQLSDQFGLPNSSEEVFPCLWSW